MIGHTKKTVTRDERIKLCSEQTEEMQEVVSEMIRGIKADVEQRGKRDRLIRDWISRFDDQLALIEEWLELPWWRRVFTAYPMVEYAKGGEDEVERGTRKGTRTAQGASRKTKPANTTGDEASRTPIGPRSGERGNGTGREEHGAENPRVE